MTAIADILLPIFALIGAGWGLVRAGVLIPADARPLSAYVMNIALPALLCGAIARRDLADVLHPGYLLVFAAAGLASMALAYAAFRLRGQDRARAATAGMGASCPNSGFVGFPIMLLVFPDHAAMILALNFMVENFLLIPVALMALELSRPQGQRPLWRVVAGLILSVLRRPLVIGLLLGLVLSLLRIDLPAPVLRLLDLAAASAGAVALVVIGVGLAGLRLTGDRAASGAIALGKLVVHPLLAVGLLALLPLLGLPVPQGALAIALVLSTAMPMFSVYPIFVQEYGTAGLASVSVLLGTLASAVTLGVALALLI
ncbi:AEC family transporter [Lacimonas salitolerans]|uniref:AEC family transporter n=1 Tax=Lacimonas salitolerans TaxID=1323750 RepID=A0ABW4ELZ8_9RHOB